ncbi:uncharacterized protein [Bemisia tabaci]|uniref:uncharacterized protein n=1 Tax=Bemisia tabaci TaxID=7038 RepID=UPI003B281888
MTTNSEEIVTPAAIHDLSPSPEPTPPASPEIIPASDEETDHPIPPLTQLTPPNPELPSTSATPDVIPAARPKAVPLIILETSDEEEDPISREEPVPKRSRLSSDGKYHNQYNWPPVAYGQRMQETVGLCEDPNTCKLLPEHEILTEEEIEEVFRQIDNAAVDLWPPHEILTDEDLHQLFAQIDVLNNDPGVPRELLNLQQQQSAEISSPVDQTPKNTDDSTPEDKSQHPDSESENLPTSDTSPQTARQPAGRPQSSQETQPQQGEGRRLPFEVIREEIQNLDNLYTVQHDVCLLLEQTPGPERQHEWIRSTLERLLNFGHERTGTQGTDFVQLVITSASNPELPLFISPRRGDQLDPDVIFARLEKVLNSNENFLLAGRVNVKFTVLKMPIDRGNNRITQARIKSLTLERLLNRKHACINIRNNDNCCLARALMLTIAHVDQFDGPAARAHYRAIKQHNRPYQTWHAMELCRGADVNLCNGGGIPEIRKFQDFLLDYTITVWSHRAGRETLFEGPQSPDRKNLDVYFEASHFVTITSLKGFFGYSHFCRYCKIGYSNVEQHICAASCPKCYAAFPCDETAEKKKCDSCNRTFNSADCWERHVTVLYSKGKPVCDWVKKCIDCYKTYNLLKRKPFNPHKCGEVYCTACARFFGRGHLCFMKKLKVSNCSEKKENKKKKRPRGMQK